MPKSNRLKADSAVATREEFETLLDSIATDQLLRDGLVLERDAEMAAIRERADKEIGPIEERMKSALIRAEKFAETHRDELFTGKNKSAETGLTVFGFRWSTPALALINRKWKWTEVVAALKAKKLTDYIIVDEKPDKDAMKAHLNGEELASVGTKIIQVESFYIEPKRDAAPDQRMTTEKKEVA